MFVFKAYRWMGFYSLFMAWNVNQVYQQLLKQLRKNQAGSVSSTDFFYAWNAEQLAYFQDLLGRFQNRTNGKSGVNTGLIENETIETKLAPFLKPATLTIIAGNSNKPNDFAYESAIRVNGFEVKKINHNQIATINDNLIDPPSIPLNLYYVIEYQSRYTFLPSSVTTAALDYYMFPLDVVWAYTLDGQNRQVYDSANSVQPMWLQTDIVEITSRTFKRLGVGFHDNQFTQYGDSVINTGN